jgi:transcriptional regulator with XRE-family HTH domain
MAELRERAGLTQAEVAERIGTTVSNYQRIEHGLQNVTLETMARVANAIGVAMVEFFGPPREQRPRRTRRAEDP